MATQLAELSPVDLTSRINKAWVDYIVAEQGRWPRKRAYTYASSFEECTRKLTLYMTDGDKLPQWEPEVLAKFHRGNERARSLIIDLQRVGQICDPPFRVVQQEQRFTLNDRKGRPAIVGQVDARLEFNHERQLPVEIKDWSEYLTAKIHFFDDCFNNPWTKKGAYQLLSYLYGAGEQLGFLLLARSGLPVLLPVSLYDHLEKVESFLTRAEEALDHKREGTLPAFIEDVEECKRCQFYGIACDPPLKTEAAQIITDEEQIAALERRETLKESAKEFEELDAEIKKRYRGVESAVASGFLLQGKWQKSTSYPVPEAVRNQYKVEDPKGKFILKIVKL